MVNTDPVAVMQRKIEDLTKQNEALKKLINWQIIAACTCDSEVKELINTAKGIANEIVFEKLKPECPDYCLRCDRCIPCGTCHCGKDSWPEGY